MSNIRDARNALIARVLRGDGRASRADREAAFANADLAEPLKTLVGKVARNAHTISDHDVARALAAGLDEDQVFEIVVSAAIGEASRQYDAALGALQDAVSER